MFLEMTKSVMMGVPYSPDRLWGEAAKASVCVLNRTLSVNSNAKAPLELRNDEPLESLNILRSGVVLFTNTSKTALGAETRLEE